MKWIEFRSREDKIQVAGQIFKKFFIGDVLDVGCDVKALRSFVSGRYVGIDIGGKPDILVDLEWGIPFRDKSFDCVVSFDTLEHLDKLHFCFDEMCRISRRFVIVGLPNMAEWRFRLNFLLHGRMPGGKYGLPVEKPLDRHRWFFHLDDAIKFIHVRGALNGFVVIEEIYGFYRYRKWIVKAVSKLGRYLVTKLFVYSYWAVLQNKTC